MFLINTYDFCQVCTYDFCQVCTYYLCEIFHLLTSTVLYHENKIIFYIKVAI